MDPHDAGALGVQRGMMDLVEVDGRIGQLPFVCSHCHTSLLHAAGDTAGADYSLSLSLLRIRLRETGVIPRKDAMYFCGTFSTR